MPVLSGSISVCLQRTGRLIKTPLLALFIRAPYFLKFSLMTSGGRSRIPKLTLQTCRKCNDGYETHLWERSFTTLSGDLTWLWIWPVRGRAQLPHAHIVGRGWVQRTVGNSSV